jgi:hypothetical protein
LRRENGRVLVFIEKNVWCGPMRIKRKWDMLCYVNYYKYKFVSKLGLLRDKRG